MITEGCVVEGNVSNSVLFASVRVAEGAVVESSILMPGAVVEGAEVCYSIIAENAVVKRAPAWVRARRQWRINPSGAWPWSAEGRTIGENASVGPKAMLEKKTYRTVRNYGKQRCAGHYFSEYLR